MYSIDPIQHGTICIQLEMHAQVQIYRHQMWLFYLNVSNLILAPG